MNAGAPAPPWQALGLPGKKLPLTRMAIVETGTDRALRLDTDASYGALTLDLPRPMLSAQSTLRWRWRLDTPLPQADLTRKDADDSPVKLCLLFDLPLERLRLGERTVLRMARAVSGQDLPSATLCYAWDHKLPAGTLMPNVYSARVRTLVLDSGDARAGQWVSHERNVTQDFLRAFGDESPALPPLTAVAIGADTDNTGGRSRAWMGDVTLTP